VIERIATFNRSEAEKLTDDESKDCRAAAMELAKSKEVGPRVSGLVALGKVGDEAAKPLALKAAKGTDPDVKEAGMKLLTRYCDDSTIPVLSAYVVSKGSTLALNAIAEQKTPVAKKALEEIAANAKKPETREAATAALKKRGDN
jgi:HEAT repeat protein